MNLEEQVTSLELSRELKKIGFTQDSLFYWHNLDSIPSVICNHWYPERSGDFFISAYTASEVFAMLPHALLSHEAEPFNSYRLYITKSFIVKDPECIELQFVTIVNYKPDTIDMNNVELHFGKSLTKNLWDANTANALAKMLIFLHDNKLLKVSE